MVLRSRGAGTGGAATFGLVTGLVMLSLVSSPFSTYSPLELREILERAWHKELRSVRGEEVLGFFTLSSNDSMLVMVIRDRMSSSSFSSFSSADVSLKYSSVCRYT